jgi:Eukaryotic aspartyl protease
MYAAVSEWVLIIPFSDLWVQSATCATCNLSIVEPFYDGTKNAFDSTRSSTYQTSRSQVEVDYGDGSALLGTISTDVVSLGTSLDHSFILSSKLNVPILPVANRLSFLGQFNVPQQTFLLATQENSNFGIAGLIGLAWPPLAQSRGTPWWLNALSQFQQPEMSFYLAEYVLDFFLISYLPRSCSDGMSPRPTTLRLVASSRSVEEIPPYLPVILDSFLSLAKTTGASSCSP